MFAEGGEALADEKGAVGSPMVTAVNGNRSRVSAKSRFGNHFGIDEGKLFLMICLLPTNRVALSARSAGQGS
jgi:hypothetical protein